MAIVIRIVRILDMLMYNIIYNYLLKRRRDTAARGDEFLVRAAGFIY